MSCGEATPSCRQSGIYCLKHRVAAVSESCFDLDKTKRFSQQCVLQAVHEKPIDFLTPPMTCNSRVMRVGRQHIMCRTFVNTTGTCPHALRKDLAALDTHASHYCTRSEMSTQGDSKKKELKESSRHPKHNNNLTVCASVKEAGTTSTTGMAKGGLICCGCCSGCGGLCLICCVFLDYNRVRDQALASVLAGRCKQRYPHVGRRRGDNGFCIS